MKICAYRFAGHARQRKSQTFSSKNDGSTPLTSKTKTSLSKRKSSTDSGLQAFIFFSFLAIISIYFLNEQGFV